MHSHCWEMAAKLMEPKGLQVHNDHTKCCLCMDARSLSNHGFVAFPPYRGDPGIEVHQCAVCMVAIQDAEDVSMATCRISVGRGLNWEFKACAKCRPRLGELLRAQVKSLMLTLLHPKDDEPKRSIIVGD